MKQRFTFLDIRTIVNEISEIETNNEKDEKNNENEKNENNDNNDEIENLSEKVGKVKIETAKSTYSSLIGTYLQNIYSTSQKSFFFKTNKSVLHIEVSQRIHLTSEVPPGNHQLTFFCTKLRLFLRRKRIKSIQQVGFDREIVLDFGEHILVVQMFSAGNLILLEKCSDFEIPLESQMEETKKQKKIQEKADKVLGKKKTILKKMTSNDDPVDFTKKYKIIEIFRPVQELDMQKGAFFRFNAVDLNFRHAQYDNMSAFLGLDKEINDIVETHVKRKIYAHRILHGRQNKAFKGGGLTGGLKGGDIISDRTGDIIGDRTGDHISDSRTGDRIGDIDLRTLDEDEILIFEEFFETLKQSFIRNKNYGKIVRKKGKPLTFLSFDTGMLEEDAEPREKNAETYRSFNECVDTFYITEKKEDAPMTKKDKIRQQQLKYVDSLKSEEESLVHFASLICENKDDLIRIFRVLNYVKDNKIDWKFFYEQKENEDDLFRERVRNVDFLKNTVIVRLLESSGKFEDVKLHFRKTLHRNIDAFFGEMKLKKTKRGKIERNLETIIANIKEKKKKKAPVTTQRKDKRTPFWFEKFNFTVTRNGFLVIGGRNSSQNEIIGKRKFEIFFHADVNGGSCCTVDGSKLRIVYNGDAPKTADPIQRVTAPVKYEIPLANEDLADASQFAFLHSNAWKHKKLMDTIFVAEDQVSKTAMTGEFVQKGGFVVRGRKGFIHNIRMEHGIGLLFCVEKENGEISTDTDKIANSYVFTPNPTEDSEIQFAMPLNGSWELLERFKHSVKLVPGNNKKGKIMKEIIETFLKSADEREKIAIKNIDQIEWLNVIVGDSRTSR